MGILMKCFLCSKNCDQPEKKSHKEDDEAIPTKTHVLKLETSCVECQNKIKKLLHKIDGVYAVDIDVKEKKVAVTGNVDPVVLIRQLHKIGKNAVLLATKDENQENTQPQNEEGGSGGGEGCSGTKLPVEEKQTSVLKVHLCCVGCQNKIRKVLLKIDGVCAVDLDVKEEKVIVTGNVDPAILIKKLRKVRKVAELLATKDGNQENVQLHKEDVQSQVANDIDAGEGCSNTKHPVEEKKKKKKEINMNEEEKEGGGAGGGEQSTTYLMQKDEAGVLASWPPSPPRHEGEWPFWTNFSHDNPSNCLIM